MTVLSVLVVLVIYPPFIVLLGAAEAVMDR